MLKLQLLVVFVSLLTDHLLAGSKIVYLQEVTSTPSDPALVIYDTVSGIKDTIETGDDLHVIYPTISSDGRWVAFSGSFDKKNYGIFLFDSNTRDIIEVVAPNGFTMQPTFSGNTKKLGFTAPISTGKNQIHVLDFDKWRTDITTQPKTLKTVEAAYYPCLSSAGFKATFHLSFLKENIRYQQIATYDIKDGSYRTYTDADNPGEPILGKAPCYSFDDSEIVFAQENQSNWDIFKINLESHKVSQLTNSPAKDYAPRFLADGSVLFASDESGRFEFYTLEKHKSQTRGDEARKVLSSSTNIWDPRASGETTITIRRNSNIMGEKRSSFASVVHKGKVYVIGGHMGFEHTYPKESFSSEVNVYDQATEKWTRLADKIHPVHGITAAGFGDYIYTFGGFAFSSEHIPGWKSLSVIERYDIINNKWEVIGNLPQPRSSNAIARIGNLVYLMGGWDSTPQYKDDTNGRFHESIIQFDLTTESVSVSSIKMIKPLRRAFTAVEKNGKIIVAGGITQGGRSFNILDEVVELDVSMKKWTQLTPLPYANFAPAIQTLGDEIYLFGGMRFFEKNYEYVNHIYSLKEGNKNWTHTGRYLSERKGFIQPIQLTPSRIGLLGGHTYDGKKDGPVSTFESFYYNAN